jgi:hypothetical protein
LIICKGFSFRTEDSLYVFAASSEMIPLVKQDAGTLLRDARDLLTGHFERCPYNCAGRREVATGRPRLACGTL